MQAALNRHQIWLDIVTSSTQQPQSSNLGMVLTKHHFLLCIIFMIQEYLQEKEWDIAFWATFIIDKFQHLEMRWLE